MKTIDVACQFKTDDDCLDSPNGELRCVHCGEVERVSKITRETKGKNKLTRLQRRAGTTLTCRFFR